MANSLPPKDPESNVQLFWNGLINVLNSSVLGRYSTIRDKHLVPTVGTLKPDCPLYLANKPETGFWVTAIGELKRRRSAENKEFTDEEKGHLLTFFDILVKKQPWREASFVIGFLSDSTLIQFFRCDYQNGRPMLLSESKEYYLSDDGAAMLCGLLTTLPSQLGYQLPSVSLGSQAIQFTEMLGQGATAMVFKATNLGPNMPATAVVKYFRSAPGAHMSLTTEQNMLEELQDMQGIPKCLASSAQYLLLEPVGEHFAASVDAYQKALTPGSGSSKHLLTSQLVGELIDILRCLHGRGFVHRDINLSNILVHSGKVSLFISGTYLV
jgi:hypothetical protein